MSYRNLLISYNDKKAVQPVRPPSDKHIVITHDEDDHEHENKYIGNNDDPDDDNNVCS